MAENPTNLIVNYLPQTLSDEEFRSMFLSIGPVKSTKIVRDKNTGYSYGFGFVDYTSNADALRAIETLNGLQLQHKTIKVAFSRQGEENRGGNLYITNIPRSVNTDQLKDLFGQYGEMVQCRIVCDKHTGLSKGIGFVLFMRKGDAEYAMQELDGYVFEGSQDAIAVKFAMDNKEKAKGMMNKLALQNIQAMGRGGGGGYGYDQSGQYDYAYSGTGMGQGGGMDMGGYGRGVGRGAPYAGPMGPRGPYQGARNAGPGGFSAPYAAGPPGPIRRGDNPGAMNRSRARFNPMGMPGGAINQAVGGEEGYVLFVYNIGADATESTLWSLFAPFGAVQKVNIIKNPETNDCKGFGFVTMTNYEEALNAIKNLDSCPFGNKILQVSFKRSK